MRAFTIDAASQESARGILDRLEGFEAELVEADGRYRVTVPLKGDREIIDLLNALERYVTDRGDGPARVELDGRAYTLHPEP